jgi:hypothetical protein
MAIMAVAVVDFGLSSVHMASATCIVRWGWRAGIFGEEVPIGIFGGVDER